MRNVYPIFRDLRLFLLIVTSTLKCSAIHTHRCLFLHVYFTRYLVDIYSVVFGLDWTGFSFWVNSWIGLD